RIRISIGGRSRVEEGATIRGVLTSDLAVTRSSTVQESRSPSHILIHLFLRSSRCPNSSQIDLLKEEEETSI
ncbi:hypothetical protein PFISCL1PPCAC_21303, partial [Pristionchus fissidentatus]